MKTVQEYDWIEVQAALDAYADHLESTEPHAVNTIALFRNAAIEAPMPEDL